MLPRTWWYIRRHVEDEISRGSALAPVFYTCPFKRNLAHILNARSCWLLISLYSVHFGWWLCSHTGCIGTRISAQSSLAIWTCSRQKQSTKCHYNRWMMLDIIDIAVSLQEGDKVIWNSLMFACPASKWSQISAMSCQPKEICISSSSRATSHSLRTNLAAVPIYI